MGAYASAFWPLSFISPVVSHEFTRILGLADRFAREKLAEHWLDIEDWRSINCIEREYAQSRTIPAEESND